jgi:tetratricopeptide (TPR) repeat protein
MKSRKYRIALCMIIFLTFCSFLGAQGDGGQAGSFLRYGIGSRAMGMGRAFVAVADDASGLYWNPAGLVGSKRIEFTSMYSNLYYDSRFANVGVVFPRLSRSLKRGLFQWLFGPSSAMGFSWVGLSMAGFEQRSESMKLLGEFGYGENAFLGAWAREEVGSWGIFRYGVTCKFVNQSFSGLESMGPNSDFNLYNQEWPFGLDIGFTFQPIHAPLFRVVSLRYLMPLRLGLAVQNLVAPHWGFNNEESVETEYVNTFPTVLRWGFSYRWIIKDWLPEAWDSMRKFFGDFYILSAFDQEMAINKKGDSKGFSTGNYFGLEGVIPLSQKGFALYSRAGFNNRMEGTALGMGLSMPFSNSALVRIDYSYGFHRYLPEDNRFFITVQAGRALNAQYFRSVSQRQDIQKSQMRKYLLRILTEYPNPFIDEAVEELVMIDDSVKTRRYFDLTGGLGRADWLFQEAKVLLKNGLIKKAQRKAQKAAQEYTPLFYQADHPLIDRDLMDYGEALIIAHQMEDAIPVLQEVEEPSLRSFYLQGICEKAVGNWDGAIEMFKEAVNRYEREDDLNNMVGLSLFQLGESFIRKEEYQSATQYFEVFLKNYKDGLVPDYPRYPVYKDDFIQDDAQYLIGICKLLTGQHTEGITSLMKTQRFYPYLEYGQEIEAQTGRLIEFLKLNDFKQLDAIARQIWMAYLSDHRWPPEQ